MSVRNICCVSMLVIALVLISACATSSKINKVSLGMTKEQVIDKLGDPDATKAMNNQETLVYFYSDTATDGWYGRSSEYWVILQNGLVRSYGRAGDFDTFSTPTKKQIIELQQSNSTQ